MKETVTDFKTVEVEEETDYGTEINFETEEEEREQYWSDITGKPIKKEDVIRLFVTSNSNPNNATETFTNQLEQKYKERYPYGMRGPANNYTEKRGYEHALFDMKRLDCGDMMITPEDVLHCSVEEYVDATGIDIDDVDVDGKTSKLLAEKINPEVVERPLISEDDEKIFALTAIVPVLISGIIIIDTYFYTFLPEVMRKIGHFYNLLIFIVMLTLLLWIIPKELVEK